MDSRLRLRTVVSPSISGMLNLVELHLRQFYDHVQVSNDADIQFLQSSFECYRPLSNSI